MKNIKYLQKSVKNCQKLMFSPQNEGVILNKLPKYFFVDVSANVMSIHNSFTVE